MLSPSASRSVNAAVVLSANTFAGNKPMPMFRSETSQKWRKSGAKVAHTRTATQWPYQVVTDVLRVATVVECGGITTER
jgi:hypothetical protein